MTVSFSAPRMSVGRLVDSPPLAVDPDTSIRDTSAVMRAENVSSVLVGGPTAIVTERDLARAWCEGRGPDDPVRSIATSDPLSVEASEPITGAAALMLNGDVRHLLVMDHGTCVGLVSVRTVLAVLLQGAEPATWLTGLRSDLPLTSEFWLG